MPAASKFTEETRTLILSAVAFGVSPTTAAESSGINRSTWARWMKQAEHQPLGRFGRFMDQMAAVRARSRLALAQETYRAALDNPRLALKLLERMEETFKPPSPQQSAPQAHPVIALTFQTGRLAELPSSTIEVLTVEPDSERQPA